MFNTRLFGYSCSCTTHSVQDASELEIPSVCMQTQQNESVRLEDTLRYLTNYSEANLLKQSHYSVSAPLLSPASLSESPDLAAGGNLIVVVTSERRWNSSRDGESEFSHLSVQSHSEWLYKSRARQESNTANRETRSETWTFTLTRGFLKLPEQGNRFCKSENEAGN